MDNKKKRPCVLKIFAISLVTVMLFGTLTAGAAAASNGRLRPITANYLPEFENSNSIWAQEPLIFMLRAVLLNDLEDTSSCDMVWEFKAEDYKAIHQWCLQHEKGTATNRQFLADFAGTHCTTDNIN